MNPTLEMVQHFDERTNEHIKRVQKYAYRLTKEFSEVATLNNTIEHHDNSKFYEPEYTPYLFVSWSYKCKAKGIPFEVSYDIKSKMHQATTHHVLTNSHHPEFWSEDRDPINKDDRDSAAKLIDATRMPDYALAEMVADWSAMAEEYKNPGPYKWAEDNINVRWKFTDKQIELIYKYIDFLWEDKVQ